MRVLKEEIAKKYFPKSSDPMRCLRRNLKAKGIDERLEDETRYNKHSRYFSEKQIQIIADELGETA